MEACSRKKNELRHPREDTARRALRDFRRFSEMMFVPGRSYLGAVLGNLLLDRLAGAEQLGSHPHPHSKKFNKGLY